MTNKASLSVYISIKIKGFGFVESAFSFDLNQGYFTLICLLKISFAEVSKWLK